MKTVAEVGDWLTRHGFERWVQVFAENEVDGEVLCELSEADLADLGLPLGPRRKLLKALAAVPEERAAAGVAATPAGTAERRQLTVMFVDLVGSTALSARLDPEEMGAVLRAYQNAVAGEIARFEGHVAKFMGDGVLAYFGWPRAHEDEAERAVRAGLAVRDAVARLTGDGSPLACRVGIATGLVVVGELIGEGTASEQTVVGDTPNLAARLQALAEPGQVVVGEATQRLLGKRFDLVALGARAIKGFSDSVLLFAVEGEAHFATRFEARSASLSPLVGRGQELALLRDHWRQAEAGRGSAVLVVGEAGIGKSRLTRALVESASNSVHDCLSYQCSPFHTGNALWPVIQQLRHAIGSSDDDQGDAGLDRIESVLGAVAAGDQAVALIADLLGIDAGSRYEPLGLTPQAKRARTLQVLVELPIGLARQKPVLVVLEDAHWIDPTTRDWLGLTLDRLAAEHLLLVVTTRPDNAPALSAHPAVTTLSLNRLPRQPCIDMVERLSLGSLSGEVVSGIVERTDGVPLFVEELTSAVVETGVAAIPSSLHDSLMARLDRHLEVKKVTQTAACIGRDFDYRLLAAIVDVDDAILGSALEVLQRSQLIFCRGSPPDAQCTFKHALVQDAAYNSLLRVRRHELHRQLAEVLLGQFGDLAERSPELVAHHFTAAGHHDPAAQYWLKAAQNSIARSANIEAIGHLERGLDQLLRLPRTLERATRELTFQRLLGTAIMAVKGYGATEVFDAFSRSLELCRLIGDGTGSDAFIATLGTFLFQITRGDHRDAARTAESLLERAERADDASAMMAGRMASGIIDCHLGQFERAHEHNAAGMATLAAQADPEFAYRYGLHVGGVLYGYDAWSLTALGFHDQALACARRSVDELERSRHLFTYARGMFWNAAFHQMRGDWKSAERMAARATEAASEQGFAMVVAVGRIVHGAAAAALDSPDRGLAEMRTGFETYQSIGARAQLSYFLALHADPLARLGMFEEAMAALDEALDFARSRNERFWEAEIHRSRARLHLAREREEDFEADIDQAIDIARRQNARWYELRATRDLARHRAASGRRQQARDRLAPIYEWFTEGLDLPDLVEARALLDAL